MATEVAALPEVRAVMSVVDDIERRLAHYTVTTAEQFQAGAAELAEVKAAQKRLDWTRVSITAPMNQALKAVLDLFRAPGDRLAAIERKIKQELAIYSDTQAALARAEQAAADDRAAKERAKLEEKAAKAAAAGKEAQAAELATRAELVAAPMVSRAPPKVAGLVARKVHKFEVIDPQLVPREYLSVDESKIRRVVNALGTSAVIAGVRVWTEQSYASRAAGE